MADNDNNGKPEDQNADAGADRTGDQSGDQDQRNAGDRDYPDDLGDAGKRAIDRMKAERDEAVRNQKAAEKALADAANTDPSRNGGKDTNVSNDGKTGDDTKPEGKSAEQVENELMARFAQQALRSTVREVASAKLADPNDALVLADFSDIKPNDFGEFDRSAIEERITKLTESKPYLAKSETKFEGSADNGNRGESGNGQVSRDQLKTMSPEEINKARAEGRLSRMLSGK